jgi:hypothetical protein
MLFCYVICYTDDLIVYSDAESHISILEQIFIILRRNNLKLAPSKCQCARDSVVYLSHVITPQGCEPCPGKIAAITTYKMCENQADLRTWVGMTSYWRCYIKDYAKICQPLTELLQKGAKWVWTGECTKAFETLREKLVTASILAHPNFDYEFPYLTCWGPRDSRRRNKPRNKWWRKGWSPLSLINVQLDNREQVRSLNMSRVRHAEAGQRRVAARFSRGN